MQDPLGILPSISALIFWAWTSSSCSSGTCPRTESGGRMCVPQIRTWCRGVRLKEVLKMLALVSENCSRGRIWIFSARRPSSLLWGKTWQSISSFVSFALSIIDPKVVLRELLSPANLKSSSSLYPWTDGGSVLRQMFLRTTGLWGFSTFDDFWTDMPPPPSSTPSYSTRIWAALVDESVDELVLSIEVSGAAILLNPWIKGR